MLILKKEQVTTIESEKKEMTDKRAIVIGQILSDMKLGEKWTLELDKLDNINAFRTSFNGYRDQFDPTLKFRIRKISQTQLTVERI